MPIVMFVYFSITMYEWKLFSMIKNIRFLSQCERKLYATAPYFSYYMQNKQYNAYWCMTSYTLSNTQRCLPVQHFVVVVVVVYFCVVHWTWYNLDACCEVIAVGFSLSLIYSPSRLSCPYRSDISVRQIFSVSYHFIYNAKLVFVLNALVEFTPYS